MKTVYTIGEALIDFIPNEVGIALKEVTGFKKAPGGAPANVASQVAILGGKSAFLGKLGHDAFGDFLIETLNNVKVDTRFIKQTHEANTALAFVSLKADGNRDFSFYRNPSADMLYTPEELDTSLFKNDILHFCSVDLVEAPVKYTTVKAIKAITTQNGLISFDPNVRLPLWEDHEALRNVILEFVPYAHILKISDEELYFITGIKDEEKAIDSLFKGNVTWIIYTKGKDGAILYTRKSKVTVNGYVVEAIDTTGAGDAFIGAFLYQISQNEKSLNDYENEELIDLLDFSNAAAALSTTKHGAISSMPTLSIVNRFMKNQL